jgi:hypothetical protein
LQFYVSLVALSQLHISNRYTLSIIFDKDLTDPKWLNDRRVCIEEILMSYLQDKSKTVIAETSAGIASDASALTATHTAKDVRARPANRYGTTSSKA